MIQNFEALLTAKNAWKFINFSSIHQTSYIHTIFL